MRAQSRSCALRHAACVGDPSRPLGPTQGTSVKRLSCVLLSSVTFVALPAFATVASPVSEPGMVELLAAGALAGLVVWVRNRRRK